MSLQSTPKSSQDKHYIYESPDGGHTVYRRPMGSLKRELVQISEDAQRKSELQQQTNMWIKILEASRTDPALADMLEEIEVYWKLKN